MSVHGREVIWTLGNWRVVYTGASVILYGEGRRVSFKQVDGRAEAEAVAADWRRSVLELIELEGKAERPD